ncbi:MAG: type II secretion system protein GspM [Thiohalomonadaceae bacterium]
MKQRLSALAVRIDALSLRERALVFLSMLAVLVFLWQVVLMDPLEARQKRLLAEVDRIQQDVRTIDEQMQLLIAARTGDPDAENRRRLAELEAGIRAADERIGGAVSSLIAPPEMARVLEDVLARQRGLRLVRVESLPAEALVAAQPETGSGVYRHGLRLVLEGSFQDGLDYLQALEGLERALYWDAVALETIDYPRTRITIEVHSLGLTEAWIGV